MKILVLTSGGDAPGMNMVLAKLYKAFKGNVYACNAGFEGLINNNIKPLKDYKPENKSLDAGSVIKCSRCPAFKTKKGFEKSLKNAQNYDYVIILGGNGSHKGAMELSLNGVNTIFIPATIDNDVDISEYSLGFDAAVHACCETYYNIMPTMKAFNRCAIFEVMGRNCGAIAREVYSKCQPDLLIENKEDLSLEKIGEIAVKAKLQERASSIVIRENIINITELCRTLNIKYKNIDFKGVVVGYLQRGTKPTKIEIDNAKSFAKLAIKQIRLGQTGYASIVMNGGEICLGKD